MTDDADGANEGEEPTANRSGGTEPTVNESSEGLGSSSGDTVRDAERTSGGAAENDESVSPPDPPERRRAGAEPHVSVTIEGEYGTVMDRIDHPRAADHGGLEEICDHLESTLVAVGITGGGIRSEVYEEVDFELEDPWEIRKYLDILAIHGLVQIEDDRWVPLRPPGPDGTGDRSG